nr:YihY/virulence factor BrkB family protein [uncultured Cohaesibacter sp.]
MPRGREAKNPVQIPFSGWKDILFRVKNELIEDRISLISAGVAFYTLLAIFPAITALMAIAGLVVEPVEVARKLQLITNFVPKDAADIILNQAKSVAGSQQGGLGLALVLGLSLSLYSASRGMASLVQGLNVAYDEKEKRGFFKVILVTLILTLIMVIGFVFAVTAAIALPALFNILAIPGWIEGLFSTASWILMAILVVTGLSIIYRFGPSRTEAKWQWLTTGAVTACVLWLIASIGFSIYVSNFGSYNETFGSMAGAIILLMWLWISTFIILMGAEFNAEIEAQTKLDSTIGPDKPMGSRGATKADTLGESIIEAKAAK